MANEKTLELLSSATREIKIAKPGQETLGHLKNLPGVWKNLWEPGNDLEGRGWNMIALPFISNDTPIDYRILMNQYNEELLFTIADEKVPNRGVIRAEDLNQNQTIVTLDYQQTVQQIAAEDMPDSGLAGPQAKPIHHEPGLFLNMLNFLTDENDVARLGTIPHGNSVLAVGKAEEL